MSSEQTVKFCATGERTTRLVSLSGGSARLTDSANTEVEHLQADQINSLISAAGVDGTREIMDTFWRSTTDLLAALASQIAEQSLPAAAGTAHAIKGSAANVGAVSLAQTASDIEVACKSGASEDAKNLLGPADENFKAVRQCFDELLAKS
ncbi:hypothetical protein MNBD_ALPHA05-1203 [hydrothermal vent metagenome]|uniref:HPt domain-containing protein n=1 Tax=hydrothermal vent metagenome TaxID=652676 RepID=A0A3B0T1K5_9ZZZZ